MDAGTRHQLKTNELADMLASLKDLRKPQYLFPAIGILVILAGVAAFYGWRYNQRIAAEQDWQRLDRAVAKMSSGDPSAVSEAQADLQGMLQEKMPASVLGYARIELARSRVEQGLSQPSERPGAFEEAAKLLEEVRSNPALPPMQQAEATFLLASTRESMRQFDQAKELYQTLTQDAKYTGSPYRTLAEKRLSDIDALAKPIAFLPGEAPAPPPPPAPTSKTMTLSPDRTLPDMMGPPYTPPPGPVTLTPLPQPQNPSPTERPQPPSPQAQPPAPQPQPAVPPQAKPAPQPTPPPPAPSPAPTPTP
jgi:predicted negative regulator of RcsB-dependent stress response